MYDDILIPTDGSEGVQRAIDHGIDLASQTDATVHAMYVVDTGDAVAIPEGQWLTIEETLEETEEEAVADIEDRARQQNVDVSATVEYGTPNKDIVRYAEENDIDLIVMGTHGRSGLDRVLLGSVTDNVIRRSETPVLVQRIEEGEL